MSDHIDPEDLYKAAWRESQGQPVDAMDRDDEHVCPICLKQFEPADLCADDIELGICHAECLEGSQVVDLETGEPSDGPVDTYRYDEVSKP